MPVVVKVKKYGDGRWIYLPKTIIHLVDDPVEFELTVEGKKIILEPVKGRS